MAKLTALKVKAFREPGRYGDGGGLYLVIRPTGSKSWVQRAVVDGPTPRHRRRRVSHYISSQSPGNAPRQTGRP